MLGALRLASYYWKGNLIKPILTKQRGTDPFSLWMFAFLGRQAYKSEHTSHLEMEGMLASWIKTFESEEVKTMDCPS